MSYRTTAITAAVMGWLLLGTVAGAEMTTAPAASYDFGDMTSATLAGKAWQALAAQDYAAVEAYTGKCITLYETKAVEQNQSLNAPAPKERAFDYWALNDVATCYFIRGKAFKEQGKMEAASADFNAILEKLSYGQCWDPKGWFWQVSEAAKDQLNTLRTSYDFGDYTSETLTTKAWQALDVKDYTAVELYTKKCISLYEADAVKQQGSLEEFAPKEKAFSFWALNDVGTCYFILGEALMAQARYEEARVAFEKVVNELSFAQCWDPKGWFWKVAVASRGRINKIAAETTYQPHS
ncbi:MAG: hypothetical protein HY597_03005 [Candidatus Omnitrophica bacterium]|nr:hypothetical protein [Candidatus Omnitrophota bacterium]